MTTLPKPIAIKAPHGASTFTIDWSDGTSHHIPHRVLRGFCPCAGCQGHSGPTQFISDGNLELMNVERVGNYAVSLTWGDGHSGGIYSFTYMHRLGSLLLELGEEALVLAGTLP